MAIDILDSPQYDTGQIHDSRSSKPSERRRIGFWFRYLRAEIKRQAAKK
jgi:hypothetical protein